MKYVHRAAIKNIRTSLNLLDHKCNLKKGLWLTSGDNAATAASESADLLSMKLIKFEVYSPVFATQYSTKAFSILFEI